MKLILVTVLILCISYCIYSKDNHESFGTKDDILECVFTISAKSVITIKKQTNNSYMPFLFLRQFLQNIGSHEVIVKGFYNTTLEPCHSQIFTSPMTIYNDRDVRAIVYASECEDVEYPGTDYDKNKVLKETINLGVRDIPKEDLNFDTLISHFWPENKTNVWEQIYDVVKILLTDVQQDKISNLIEKDIASIKEKVVEIKDKSRKSIDTDLKIEYATFAEYISKRYLFVMNGRYKNKTDIYISSLYSNFVTMKMYFYLIGSQIDYSASRALMYNLLCDSWEYIDDLSNFLSYGQYMIDFAGGLYNEMMNTRSHFAVHVLEMFPVWNKIYKYIKSNSRFDKNVYPLSYSNFYGKATPKLLQQATHIRKSALVGQDESGNVRKLYNIWFYIKKDKKQIKTVYGLKLEFTYGLSYPMGTTKVASDIIKQELYLMNRNIMELEVYKSKYIRCLEFRLSDGENVTFGNYCENNSVSSIFRSKGHYIHSLYLANDYPGSKKYFDNVAVSYLPKP